MERGKQVLWLVSGGVITGLGAATYVTEISAGRIHVMTGLPIHVMTDLPWEVRVGFGVWLVLSYCMFRRQPWARWIAVALVAAAGLRLTVVVLTLLLLTALGAVEGTSWQDVLALFIGITFLGGAGILTFSEAIGDFFGWVPAGAWSQAPADAAAAQAVRAFRREELLDADATRPRASRRAQRVSVIALALGWIVFIGGTGLAFYSVSQSFQEAASHVAAEAKAANDFSESFAANVPMGGFVGGFLIIGFGLRTMVLVGIFFIVTLLAGVFTLLGGYFLLFILPSLVAMPFVLRFAWCWHSPVTFLVLRPFNRERITAQLARFLRDEVAPFGHCYTLSDRKIRVPLHIRVPLVWGQLSFFNFRFRKIRRPKHIDKLVAAMGKRVPRNLNWCLSRTKLFPVTCSDAGWRSCVARLAQTVDVVVVDLSSVTGNIVWELELLRDTGALDRTVLVVQESQLEDAQEGVSKVMGYSRAAPILPYGSGAVARERAASARIVEVLCSESRGAGLG